MTADTGWELPEAPEWATLPDLEPLTPLTEDDYSRLREERYRAPAHRHAPGKGRKPPRLDSPAVQHLLAALEAGNFLSTAAEAAGLSERTVHRWLERGRAEDAADAPGDYWHLWQAIETARFIAVDRALTVITTAAQAGAWRAAAWWLERARPDSWGRRSRGRGREAASLDVEPVTPEALEELVQRILKNERPERSG